MIKYLFFVVLFLPGLGFGQNINAPAKPDTTKADTLAHMHLIYKNYGSKVVLRWAPGDAATWILTKQDGYKVTRRVYEKDANGDFKEIAKDSVHIPVWTMQQWQQYFEASHDSLAAMAAELLYGETLPFKAGSMSMQDIINKYHEQQNRFGFALMIADFNAKIAEGLGLRYEDSTIDKDHYYTYAVTPVDSQRIIRSDTALVFVNGGLITKPSPSPILKTVAGDQVIHLFWYNNPTGDRYSAFYIERSKDGQNYKRLNRLPYVYSQRQGRLPKPIEFIDTTIANYVKYRYRVIGISAFGDLSKPSDVVIGMGRDLTPPHPPIITQIQNTDNGSKISFHWEKNVKEADFIGYVVGRSVNLDGPYESLTDSLLGFETHDFTDEHPKTGAPNYYIVAAVDTALNSGRSMPAYMNAEDHTPPAQPTGLAGKIDSTGIVHIHWNWNVEPDLAGYRIFFSNNPSQVFTPLLGILIPDTLFTDSITVKTLTKDIYYQVIAYDRNRNASPASEILKLAKPDVIPPMAAIIHDFNVSDTSVALQWYRSASEDVAAQKLYRKDDSTNTWVLIEELPAIDSAYTDNDIKPLHNYSYSIEAFDSSGLSSGKSFPLNVYVYSKGYSGVIKNFEVSKNDSSAVLSWAAPVGDISYYILYKGKNNTGLKMAGNIPGNKMTYKESIGKGSFQYAIKAIYENGKESAVSEVKTLIVQ